MLMTSLFVFLSHALQAGVCSRPNFERQIQEQTLLLERKSNQFQDAVLRSAMLGYARNLRNVLREPLTQKDLGPRLQQASSLEFGPILQWMVRTIERQTAEQVPAVREHERQEVQKLITAFRFEILSLLAREREISESEALGVASKYVAFMNWLTTNQANLVSKYAQFSIEHLRRSLDAEKKQPGLHPLLTFAPQSAVLFLPQNLWSPRVAAPWLLTPLRVILLPQQGFLNGHLPGSFFSMQLKRAEICCNYTQSERNSDLRLFLSDLLIGKPKSAPEIQDLHKTLVSVLHDINRNLTHALILESVLQRQESAVVREAMTALVFTATQYLPKTFYVGMRGLDKVLLTASQSYQMMDLEVPLKLSLVEATEQLLSAEFPLLNGLSGGERRQVMETAVYLLAEEFGDR